MNIDLLNLLYGGDIGKHLSTLYFLADSIKAKTIVELGVQNGNSTLFLHEIVKKYDGYLYSFDIEHTVFTSSFNSPFWKFTLQDDLDAGSFWNKSIDFLFVDSNDTDYHTREVLRLWAPWIRLGGIIAFHDVYCDIKDQESYNFMPAIKDFLNCRLDFRSWLFKTAKGLCVLVRGNYLESCNEEYGVVI